MTEEENRFKNDYYNREFQQLKDIDIQNQLYKRQQNKEMYDEAKENLKNAALKASMMQQQNLQKLNNILSENLQNRRLHSKQVYDSMRVYRGAKKDYLEQMKASHPEFFYKKDNNGNYVKTSAEEQQKMLAEWEKDFDTGAGKEYANLVNDVMNYGGKGFLGAFRRNKGYLPYSIEESNDNTLTLESGTINEQNNTNNTTTNNSVLSNNQNTQYSNNNQQRYNSIATDNYNIGVNLFSGNSRIRTPSIISNQNTTSNNNIFSNSNTNPNLQMLYPYLFGYNNNKVYQGSGKMDIDNEYREVIQLMKLLQDKEQSSKKSKGNNVVINNSYLDRLIANLQKTDALMIAQDNQFRQNIYDSIRRATDVARSTFLKM
jgi:hypothetical protein